MQLATLGQRFGGRIVDNLATTFVFIVTVVFAAAFIPKQRPELDWIAGAGAIAALMLIPIINCFLIMRDGRTIGKIIAGTQIVLESTGKPPGFVEGVFLRSWLPTIAMMIPGIGGLAGLADALFIFGEKRQCLHDMIAKTRVVEYQQPTVPTTSPFA